MLIFEHQNSAFKNRVSYGKIKIFQKENIEYPTNIALDLRVFEILKPTVHL